MQKIGEVSTKYAISARTLRFWEESGLIQSERTESGYRLYDDDMEKRIRQILILRQLALPLSDIETIFRSGSLAVAIRLIQTHQTKLEKESAKFHAISLILTELLDLLKKKKSISEMFETIANPESVVKPDLIHREEPPFQKEKSPMNEQNDLIQNDLRLVSLQKMTMAGISADGENPEDACWEPIQRLMKEYKLDQEPGFRNFGFGYNRCTDGEYVYTVWITVPKQFAVPKPFVKAVFPGGLFAVLPCTLFNIGERWNELYAKVDESEHLLPDAEREQCFEEVLDMTTFFDPKTPYSERQLDLLLPVRKVAKKGSKTDQKEPLKPEIVPFSSVRICGAEYPFDKPLKPIALRIPWYKLAQSLVKAGPTYQEHIVKGTDTYALVTGSAENNTPFYFDMAHGRANSVFAAVEMCSPFALFPDHLQMRTIPARKCVTISALIDPENGESSKILLQEMFASANEFVKANGLTVDPEAYLFREYRQDGRHVERIALYFFLI